MKRIIYVVTALVASMSLMAAPALRHIDTNGPKGESLFKEDANGFAEYKAVIPFMVNYDEAVANVQAWVKGLGKSVQVTNLVAEEGIVSFCGKVDVNEDLSLFRVMVGDSAKYYSKAESQLYFNCAIEVREGRMRIVFSNILSERESIKGNYIESEGPVNDIYWNRVNGIRQRQAKAKNANAKSWSKALNYENKLYQIEYQVIADLAQSLRTSMMSYTEEEW
jgi:hypothetical protein